MNFVFPEKQELKLRLKDLLENEVDEKYYLNAEQIDSIKNSTFQTNKRRIQKKDYCDTLCARDWKDPKCVQVAQMYGTEKEPNPQAGRIYDSEGISLAMDSCNGGNRMPKILNNTQIRKLTPKECWRLMGFSDEDFEKAEKVCSNTQLYKQAGNSIVVNVLVNIFTNLFKEVRITQKRNFIMKMLKIKENVNLEGLIKYGFEKHNVSSDIRNSVKSNYYCKRVTIYYDNNEIQQLLLDYYIYPNTREISLRTSGTLDDVPLDDTIYELIKADLIDDNIGKVN